MADSLRVDWKPGTPFLTLIQGLTARMSRRWGRDDPLEALPDVYRGLRRKLIDGEVVEQDSGLIWIIVFRRVTNYYKGREKRGICQLARHAFDDGIARNLDSGYVTPLDEMMYREFRDALDIAISAMPPLIAEAVRSYLGYPGSPNASELARQRGTSRQSVHIQMKKGREELRRVAARFATKPVS